MNDILGRELKAGDLVIGMVIARGSDGMRHGLYNGNSVHWKQGSYITTSTMTNIYLVENPCAKELKIKEDIIAIVEKYRIEAEKREAAKKLLTRIPTRELKVGKVYKDANGNTSIYLGKGKVIDSYRNTTKEGIIYMYPNFNYDVEKQSCYYLPSIDVLKNHRKLVQELPDIVPKIDFTTGQKEFIIKEEGYGYNNGWGNKAIKTLTIKLD